MGIISNITAKYYDNLFKIHLKDKNLKGLNELLLKSSKNKDIFIDLVFHNIDNLISEDIDNTVIKKNLIWVNSFNVDDCDYINKFITYYLSDEKIFIKKYDEYISELDIHKKFEKILFDDFLNHSYFFQFLISYNHYDSFNFINSAAAFFETESNKYFTHINQTRCYIYITKNPKEVLHDLTLKYDDQNRSINELLNLDQHPTILEGKMVIEETKKNWAVNAHSWLNDNTMNTYRGLHIKYESLRKDTADILASIVFHLNDAGMNLRLDYQKIDDFISKNGIPPMPEDIDISNRVRKNLARDLLDTANKYGYSF